MNVRIEARGNSKFKKTPSKHTPSVEFRISAKLSSSNNAYESSGIKTVCPPKLIQQYKTMKKKHVVRSRGLEANQRFLLFFAAANVAPLGDIIPRVSMEMRRIAAEQNDA